MGKVGWPSSWLKTDLESTSQYLSNGTKIIKIRQTVQKLWPFKIFTLYPWKVWKLEKVVGVCLSVCLFVPFEFLRNNLGAKIHWQNKNFLFRHFLIWPLVRSGQPFEIEKDPHFLEGNSPKPRNIQKWHMYRLKGINISFQTVYNITNILKLKSYELKSKKWLITSLQNRKYLENWPKMFWIFFC